MLKRTNEEGWQSLWGFPGPEITWACLREKRQISQNQREDAKQYCEYAPWLGVIVQIWHPILESGSKKDTLSWIQRPKSIP